MSKLLMSTRGVCQLLVVASLLFFAAPLLALEVPPLKGRVNDVAEVLAPATVQQLEGVLRAFEVAESTQIVVLIIPSLAGDSLEDFSLRVVEAWKIGQARLDNGVLLLIVKNDRKLRIEVGYGLEGKLTDLVAGRIIRDVITPRFKDGNFDQGVIDGLSAMMAAVKGEFQPSDSIASSPKKGKGKGLDFGAIFLFVLIAFTVVGRLLSRRPFLAGGIGAILAPAFWFLLLGMGGGIGFLLLLVIAGFIFGLVAASRATTGGGGHGGGFIGSGGFSGGGGSFGGGGASGSW